MLSCSLPAGRQVMQPAGRQAGRAVLQVSSGLFFFEAFRHPLYYYYSNFYNYANYDFK